MRSYYEAYNPVTYRELGVGLIYEVVRSSSASKMWKNVLSYNLHREYFCTRQVATIGDKHLTLEVKIKRVKLQAIVNSEAQRNFISPTVVLEYYLPTEIKDNGYHLVLADGKVAAKGLIEVQTKSVHIDITRHSETIQFDITKIRRHDIILGLP